MTFCNKGKLKVKIANFNDVKKFKHMAAILQNYSYSSTNLTRQLHEANESGKLVALKRIINFICVKQELKRTYAINSMTFLKFE